MNLHDFLNGPARPIFHRAWWAAIILNMFAGFILPACSLTPEGKQAKADAAVINKNAVVAQKATRDAKDGNSTASSHISRAESLDSRIDGKDQVLSRAKIIP